MKINGYNIEPKADLSNARLFEANLKGLNLREANLFRAYLGSANLEGVNLEKAKLFEANLKGANLKKANLKRANLFEAKLGDANLEGANLEGANLFRTNLEGANLEGANLEGANLEGAYYNINTIWPKGFIPRPLPKFDIELDEEPSDTVKSVFDIELEGSDDSEKAKGKKRVIKPKSKPKPKIRPKPKPESIFKPKYKASACTNCASIPSSVNEPTEIALFRPRLQKIGQGRYYRGEEFQLSTFDLLRCPGCGTYYQDGHHYWSDPESTMGMARDSSEWYRLDRLSDEMATERYKQLSKY